MTAASPPANPRPAALLGLMGQPGAGKDTVGAMLQASGWLCTSFAEAIRTEVAEHWRMDPRLLSEQHTKERPMPALAVRLCGDEAWCTWAAHQGHDGHTPRSPRWALQQWGSFRLQQQADYWIRHVRTWLLVAAQQRPGQPCAITDVRYPAEAATLRTLGARLVRVHRPRGTTRLAADTASHPTEQHLHMPADGDIVNNGSFYDLALDVQRVLCELGLHHPTEPTA